MVPKDTSGTDLPLVLIKLCSHILHISPHSYDVSQDFTLTITSVEQHDDGNYRCVATNPQSSAKSKKATLTVNSEYSNFEVYLENNMS